MSIEQFTVNTPEFCPVAEIDAVARENAVFQLACFSGACAELRADVFQRLQQYSAQREGKGWALYAVNPNGEEGAVGTISQYKEVLLLTDPIENAKEIEGHPVPIIHIITNEVIPSTDGAAEYLTFDLALDHEDDVQYCIDATRFRDGIDTRATSALIFAVGAEDGILQFNRSVQAFVPREHDYCYRNGKLLSLWARYLLPWTRGLEPGEPFSFELFGDYRRLSDKVDALALARGIMKEIATLEPVLVKRDYL